MLCMECGAKAENGFTTDVTELGNCSSGLFKGGIKG